MITKSLWLVFFSSAAALLTGCGSGDSNSGVAGISAVQPAYPTADTAISPADNVIPVTVGRSLVSPSVNVPLVTIKVCVPGTQICQSIDHVLLDTGSTGLSIFSNTTGGEINTTMTPLPHLQDVLGRNIYDCFAYGDGFVDAGGMYQADVYIGNHKAPIQTIGVFGDSETYFSTLCQRNPVVNTQPSGDYVIQSPSGTIGRGINGILGIAPYKLSLINETTAQACDSLFSCVAYQYTSVNAPSNILSRLTTDNNGFTLSLPSLTIPADSEYNSPPFTGNIILGINTKSNNIITSTPIYLSSEGYIFCYSGSWKANILFDTGGVAYFIGNSLINLLTPYGYSIVYGDFIALPDNESLHITLPSYDAHNTKINLEITISDTATMKKIWAGSVIPDLVFTNNIPQLSNTFDFGIPFFFGKNVSFLFDGATMQGNNTVGPAVFIN